MGGHAIKGAVRLQKGEYDRLWGEIRARNLHLMIKRIPSYFSKADFGDMDLLICSDHSETDPDYKGQVLKNAGLIVTERVSNSDVDSFGVMLDSGRIFQIDIIASSRLEFDFAYNYFSFNDAGNLIGRIARGLGLKFGHDGLWCTQRNEHTILKQHRLTLEFEAALMYLRLDADQWNLGFETMEQVFDWVMASPYYDWNRFDLTQRNHRARTRDAKRPNYRAFLEYAQQHPERSHALPPKETFLEHHFNVWVGLEEAFINVELENIQRQQAKELYNGDILMELTGLTGKGLGAFMSFLGLTPKAVLDMPDVQAYVMEKFQTWQNIRN